MTLKHLGSIALVSLLLVGCNQSAQGAIESELNETRGELSETRRRLNELETDLAEARADATTFKQQADILEQTGAAIPNEVEGVAALRVETETLAEDALDMQENQRELEAALLTAREETAALRDEVRGLSDERVDLEGQLAEARADVMEARTRAENIDDLAETQAAALDVADNAVNAEVIALESDLETVISERDNALEQLENMQASSAEAREVTSSLREAQGDLEQQMQSIRNEAAALPDADQIETYQTQIGELQAALSAAREEVANRPTQKQFEFLETEMRELRQALDNRPTEAEVGVLRERLAARPNTTTRLDRATLEGRLLEACAQLGVTFTAPDTFDYCDGYLALTP